MTAELRIDNASGPRRETEAERRARIRHEALVIAQAEADIEAGLGIDDDDMEAWLDALDANPDTPLPERRGSVSAPRR